MICAHCGNECEPRPHNRGNKPLYCDDRCKRAAARKRYAAANYKSLGLFVPGIMKKTKEPKHEWGYT